MSSETLENLEDGVTRLLDELKTTIYHQLPQLRGGIRLLPNVFKVYLCC